MLMDRRPIWDLWCQVCNWQTDLWNDCWLVCLDKTNKTKYVLEIELHNVMSFLLKVHSDIECLNSRLLLSLQVCGVESTLLPTMQLDGRLTAPLASCHPFCVCLVCAYLSLHELCWTLIVLWLCLCVDKQCMKEIGLLVWFAAETFSVHPSRCLFVLQLCRYRL